MDTITVTGSVRNMWAARITVDNRCSNYMLIAHTRGEAWSKLIADLYMSLNVGNKTKKQIINDLKKLGWSVVPVQIKEIKK